MALLVFSWVENSIMSHFTKWENQNTVSMLDDHRRWKPLWTLTKVCFTFWISSLFIIHVTCYVLSIFISCSLFLECFSPQFSASLSPTAHWNLSQNVTCLDDPILTAFPPLSKSLPLYYLFLFSLFFLYKWWWLLLYAMWAFIIPQVLCSFFSLFTYSFIYLFLVLEM